MFLIENQTYEQERALYNSQNVQVKGCTFNAASALKESRVVRVEDSCCNSNFPFWHVRGLEIAGSDITANSSGAIWYSENVAITESKLNGDMALRECTDVTIVNSTVDSPEFGWSIHGMRMAGCGVNSVYFMMRAENLKFTDIKSVGKYAFQYVRGGELESCEVESENTLWHAKDMVIRDCTLIGERLGWYSDGLTLYNCRIVGAKPLCYCANLKLVDCEMVDTDRCFEKSDVEANIISPVLSIKNPRSGKIYVPSVGKVIMDDEDAHGEVVIAGEADDEE